jgi:hypothetical protein
MISGYGASDTTPTPSPLALASRPGRDSAQSLAGSRAESESD